VATMEMYSELHLPYVSPKKMQVALSLKPSLSLTSINSTTSLYYL